MEICEGLNPDLSVEMEEIRCRSTVARKRSLNQNDDYGRLRHDMDLRFDAYESRFQVLSRKYLHA
jgi:hypothetical protein